MEHFTATGFLPRLRTRLFALVVMTFLPLFAYALLVSGSLLVIGLGVLTLGGLWFGITRLFHHPFHALMTQVQSLADGESDGRVNLDQMQDLYELTVIAGAFNEMVDVQKIRQSGLERSLDDSQFRERLHMRQLRFMVQVGSDLSSSLDYETNLQVVADRATQHTADWCIFYVIEDGQLKLTALAHADRSKRRWAERLVKQYALFENEMPGVVRDKRPKLINGSDNLNKFYDRVAQDAKSRQEIAKANLTSVMILPISLRDQVFGMMIFAFAESGEIYDLQHMFLAAEVARHAAVAIDNAKSYRQMQMQEERLRKLNAELDMRVEERTEQLSLVNKELEAFSYSVSHDLRTPLRAIAGFSHALEEDYADKLDSYGLDYLHRVRAATERMEHLIEDLLKFSRLARGEVEVTGVNLSKIAHELVAELRGGDPTRKIEVRIQDGLMAQGDIRLLYIVMQNLIGNAWKFSAKQDAGLIEFFETVCDGEPAFCVRDNGVGFDMAYADKLFRAFKRLHLQEDFEGNGIGLATVQRIVHRHGGRVWAESEPGKGASFYFTLTDTDYGQKDDFAR
jgi:signal transduction histidine kinase